MNDTDTTARRIVDREVFACLSSLVSTLALAAHSAFGAAPGWQDVDELTQQAFELAAPIPDYEEAAREAGWSVVKHHGAGFRAVKNEAASDDDVTDYCAAEDEAWQAACEHDDIEPYAREVFEHWAISSWLADKLEAKGEKVDRDFANLIVWARTTTGQAIYCDSVLQDIAQDLARSASDAA